MSSIVIVMSLESTFTEHKTIHNIGLSFYLLNQNEKLDTVLFESYNISITGLKKASTSKNEQ